MEENNNPGELILDNIKVLKLLNGDKYWKIALILGFALISTNFITLFIPILNGTLNEAFATKEQFLLINLFLIIIVWPLLIEGHSTMRRQREGIIYANGIKYTFCGKYKDSIKLTTKLGFIKNDKIEGVAFDTIPDSDKRWGLSVGADDNTFNFEGATRDDVKRLVSHFESIKKEYDLEIIYWDDFKEDWNISDIAVSENRKSNVE